MNPSDLTALLSRLSRATKNQPSADDIDLIVESVIDNKLTDDEIRRAYKASRDASEPWWPKPGEFLARARPAGLSKIAGEAETIFQNLLDRPDRYGKYNPHTGMVLDRKKVEARHGEAAGMAFAAVASRFRGLLEESVPFVRKDFQVAYDDARRDHGAPLALTPPDRQISAPVAAKAIRGAASETVSAEDQEKRLMEMIRNPPESSFLPEDFEERKAVLMAQAEAFREAGQEAKGEDR